MIEFNRKNKQIKSISIIPLIDVALFLLIFFMVAGTIEKFEIIPIAPPQAESSKLMDEGHIVILLGKHEEIVLLDELLTTESLEEKIKEQLKSNPNKIITIKADGEIPAERMLVVMESLRRSGAKNLSIATQRKEE